MRSYNEGHLQTLLAGAATPKGKRPVFRTSALFPVFNLPGIRTRISFMGYWLVKRGISEVSAVITLRSGSGEMVHRTTESKIEAKAYRIEIADLLAARGVPVDTEFVGSLEIEFFTGVDMVYPFPAVVVNYYGPGFTAAVHTSQRVYNDAEDARKNSESHVPEAGFNVYADGDREPFFALINGWEAAPASTVRIEAMNADGDRLHFQIPLNAQAPYETNVIYPARYADLRTFLKGRVGTLKANFDVKWVFPRLVAGNFHHRLPALSVTHTYYDLTGVKADTEYWTIAPDHHPAALLIPVSLRGGRRCSAYFYPIYSPSDLDVDVEIFSAEGESLGRRDGIARLTSEKASMVPLDFNEICASLGLDGEGDYAANVIVRPREGSRLPTRVKIALDHGFASGPFPCNLCTNLEPCTPALEAKPSAFRWAPLLADQPQAELWVTNSSRRRDYRREARVDLTFFREQDDQTLRRQACIGPNGFLVVRVQEDAEVRDFLGGQPGWVTVTSDNAVINTFYFAIGRSGGVAGDHGF